MVTEPIHRIFQNGVNFIMGDIVEFESNLPHEVSEVICLKCLKRWIAVYPSGTWLKDLHCKCGETGYVINTGQLIDLEDEE